MKILVTGSSGFIGTNLIRRLKEDSKLNITGLDVLPGPHTDIVEDLCVSDHIEKAQPPYDCIIHLAGLSGVRQSDICPLLYADNCKMSINVFNSARKNGNPRVIYASSSSVYSDREEITSEDTELTVPKSIYALSKQFLESIAKYYWTNFKVKSIGLRFFTVYGQGARTDMGLYKFVHNACLKEPITIFGDGDQSRDYTHVKDIVQGICKCIDNNTIDFDIFNLGTSNPIKINKIIDLIEERLGYPLKRIYTKANPADVKLTYAEITKASKILGYKPQCDFRNELKYYIDYIQFLDNPNPKKVFITSLFTDDASIDLIDKPGFFKKIPGWDYILYTNGNIESTTTSWNVVKLDIKSLTTAKKGVTRSRLPKFNCWAIPNFDYDVVVYMDSIYSPKPDQKLWSSIADNLKKYDFLGYKHQKEGRDINSELDGILNSCKDTEARVNKYRKYMSDRNATNGIPIFENCIFAYCPKNQLIKEVFLNTWKFIESDEISHRDQPIHAYHLDIYRPKFKNLLTNMNSNTYWDYFAVCEKTGSIKKEHHYM